MTDEEKLRWACESNATWITKENNGYKHVCPDTGKESMFDKQQAVEYAKVVFEDHMRVLLNNSHRI